MPSLIWSNVVGILKDAPLPVGVQVPAVKLPAFKVSVEIARGVVVEVERSYVFADARQQQPNA